LEFIEINVNPQAFINTTPVNTLDIENDGYGQAGKVKKIQQGTGNNDAILTAKCMACVHVQGEGHEEGKHRNSSRKKKPK